MYLKIFVCCILTAGILLSCSPVKQVAKTPEARKIELLTAQKDSTEYELIVIDPGFESWFVMNRKPAWYYTNDYLANWNYQYVISWNEKVRNPSQYNGNPGNPFIQEIDYRRDVDYGLDLNYKLYQYFRYIEATWGKILPYDRHN
jgi:hypothetical protein